MVPVNPRALARSLTEQILRLQNTIHRLQEQSAAGRPAADEAKLLRQTLDELQVHHDTYSAQLRGVADSVSVGRADLERLEGHAFRALRHAQDVAQEIRNRPKKAALPVNGLPAHVGLLSPHDQKSFELDFAIMISLLESWKSPMAADAIATLLDKASRLGALNRKCESVLDQLVSFASSPEDQAQIRLQYESIAAFKEVLDYAGSLAAASAAPGPVTTPRAPVDNHGDIYDATPRIATANLHLPDQGLPADVRTAERMDSVMRWLDDTEKSAFANRGAPSGSYAAVSFDVPFVPPPVPAGSGAPPLGPAWAGKPVEPRWESYPQDTYVNNSPAPGLNQWKPGAAVPAGSGLLSTEERPDFKWGPADLGSYAPLPRRPRV